MAIHGKNGKIVVGASGEVAEVVDWSLEESADTVDVSYMKPDDGNPTPKEFIAGMTSWTGQMTVRRNRADSDGQVAMRAGLSMAAKLYPEGSATNKKYWSGTIIVTKMGSSGSTSTVITDTFTLQGTGALSEATA